MTYLKYLTSLVTPQRGQRFGSLLNHLYDTEFHYSILNDGNRSYDGLALREEYGEQHGEILINAPCSVLEMLIGLSRRMGYLFLGSKYERPYGEWFWILIENLGLEYFDNDQIDFLGLDEIDVILDVWLDRRYERNGEGGLFPLRRARRDQRKIEIWDQMSMWIAENYPF